MNTRIFTGIKSLSILFIGMFLSYTLSGQSARQKGDRAWSMGKYKTAINNYSSVEGIAEDKELLAKRGLGYFKLNKLTRAINDFTLSKKLGNQDPYLYFLMAQTKQHLNDYEEAAFFYKQYIKEAGEKEKETELALREIKNCAYAAFHKKDSNTGFVESFGEEINTYYDEVYTLQSPTFGSSYYFSSNRNLTDNDVFAYSLDEKGNWQEEKTLVKGINTKADEYVMDVSADGRSLLYNKTSGLQANHRVYVSTWDEKDKQHIIELPENLLLGAVDLQLVDRNTIAFASKDLGGLGGYDIFVVNYKNGRWSKPIHQGDIINSEYDDRSPYFASTMQFLYFSSNRPYCYGGFDIYYYNLLGIKEVPSNIGAPINSSGNDLHFRLHTDGQMAVMSSDRKTGEGAYDIYQVFMQDFKPMPAKDTFQLEYVQDYLDSFKPKEKKKTHLEKLKEKLVDSDEAKVKEEEQKAAEAKRLKEEAEKLAAEKAKKEKDEADRLAKEEQERLAAVANAEMEKKEREQKEKEEKAKKDKLALEAEAKTKRDEEERKAAEARALAQEKAEKETRTLEAEDKAKKDKEESERKAAEIAALAKEKAEKEKQAVADVNQVRVKLPPVDADKTKDNNKSDDKANKKLDLLAGEHLANTLLYQDSYDLMNEVNKTKLDQLVTYLKDNTHHTVQLIAHTDHLELGLEEFMLYNTLKRANLIADYLLEQGVEKERIGIESVMSNYPLAKELVGGKTNEKYLVFNKRVDYEIRDADNFVLMSLDFSDMKIPGYAQDRRFELFSQLREEVYYSVQIASAERIFKNAVLRIYDDIYIRKEHAKANNDYYIGIYNKYQDALVLREDLKDSSAPYAKIVPFYNGQPIAKSALKKLSKEYPDLKKYLAASGK